MIYLLYTLHILVCFFLILVVLLQQGKGADLSVFGGGSTQTAFGARGAATVLHKLTVGCFIAFIITTVGIAAFQGGAEGGSVIDDLDEPAVEETATPGEATTGDAAAGDEAAPADDATPADRAPTDAGTEGDGASEDGQ